MNASANALCAFLRQQAFTPFSLTGRIDDRRYLPRTFPAGLPLLVTLQEYPHYRQMVGESWMHWHDYYEVWMSTGGHGEYRCGNHAFAFGPGDVVVVDPLKLHGVLRMERNHAPLVVFFPASIVGKRGVISDARFLAAWDQRPEKRVPRLDGNDPGAAPVHVALHQLAEAWFDPATGETREVALEFRLIELLFQLRQAFLAGYSRQLVEPVSVRSEREARLRQVLDYVAQNCANELSQPEVARTVGMSVSSFREFFKETTGWRFGDYLRDLRLDRAARLLRESDEPIAEVAQRSGFADQSHLTRLFKEKYGITPLQYRKQRPGGG
jgi:AraC-like DNA-binding protein